MNNNDQELLQRINELTDIVGALQIELNQVRERQEQLEEQDRGRNEFRRGDRIVILNNHRNERVRTAIVTRVHGERVYFTLDGRPTYRLRQNVERIS